MDIAAHHDQQSIIYHIAYVRSDDGVWISRAGIRNCHVDSEPIHRKRPEMPRDAASHITMECTLMVLAVGCCRKCTRDGSYKPIEVVSEMDDLL